MLSYINRPVHENGNLSFVHNCLDKGTFYLFISFNFTVRPFFNCKFKQKYTFFQVMRTHFNFSSFQLRNQTRLIHFSS
jgi:hypothetical protein